MAMTNYHFTLVLKGVETDGKMLEDKLNNAGCHDALICSHNQTVYLEFERQAESVKQAIDSALANIRTAGYQAMVI